MDQMTDSMIKSGASIRFESVWKTYGSHVAVADLNLLIASGEFCTILGPSGSGKTTSLMMIAGFVHPSSGRIFLEGQDITSLPPQKRGLGVVFQNYALFPHMTIFDNVAFALKMRGVPRTEIRERVRSMLKIVDLRDMEERLPQQLSGGQQQRVALARALVFEPNILLMDEPLGALDKKLRVNLQLELKRLHRRLDVTIVYVTHDQEEALTMSDTVVVMNEGRIEQAGTPEELYEKPETTFVANFIGETNLLPGTLTDSREGVGVLEQPTGRRIRGTPVGSVSVGERIVASMRPERLRLSLQDPTDGELNVAHGRIVEITYLGEMIRYHILLDEARPSLAQPLIVKQPPISGPAFTIGDHPFISWSASETRLLRSPSDS